MLKVWTLPLNKVSSKALGGSQLGGRAGIVRDANVMAVTDLGY